MRIDSAVLAGRKHEPAMIEALLAGRLRGAALDVAAREPLPPSDRVTLPLMWCDSEIQAKTDSTKHKGHKVYRMSDPFGRAI